MGTFGDRSHVIGMLLATAVAAGVVISGCGQKEAKNAATPATAVEVVQLSRASIAASVSVTGAIRALDDVTLSAKQGGKVTSAPFREGDRVSAGATVVQQQQTDLINAVSSSKAALASAETRLSQAQTTSQVQDVTSDTTLRQATQALAAARQRLAVVKEGARTQEIAQSQAAVEAARANASNARTSLDRTRRLFQQGAVAKADLDAAEKASDVAEANLRSAEQALSLTKAGARPEEVRQSEIAVQQAQEQVREAQANLKQKTLRREDIQAARAAVQQAKASLAMAQQALADSSIRSPVAGVVAARTVEPGQMVSPGSPLIRVYNPATVYYEATIPQVNIAEIKAGQQVTVRSDGAPGKTFHGRVTEIYPAADTANRSFHARISIADAGLDLKPGMFAKGGIVVQRHDNVLVLPRDAILNTPEGQKVFVVTRGPVKRPVRGAKPDKSGKLPMETVDGTIVRPRSVTTGLTSGTRVEIVSGLSEGDRVVRTGQAYLKDGQEVNIVSSSADPDTQPAGPEAQAR